MAHNIYIDEGADGEKPSHPNRSATRGVKVIRDSDWLPDHLVNAVWDEFTSNQLIVYGELLQRYAGAYLPKSDEENTEVKRVIDIGHWLQQWGHDGFSAHGAP